MSPQIRRATFVVLAGFLVLAAGAGYWQVLRADQLEARSGNPRVAELAAREDRGAIISADGTLLATSDLGPDGRRRRTYLLPSLAHTLGYVSARYGVSG